MTKEHAPALMMGWVKDHLWLILAGLAALYTGYLSAMNDMQQETAKLEKDQALMEERLDDLEGNFNEMHPRQP